MRSVSVSALALCLSGVVAAADHHGRNAPDVPPPGPVPTVRGAALPVPPAAPVTAAGIRRIAASPVTVVFERTAVWEGGYAARIRIANAGTSAITGWRLEFDLPDRIESVWNARLRSGADAHRVIVPIPAAGTIEAGGAVTLGLRVKGSAVAPTGCLLNGEPCPLDIGTAATPDAGGAAPWAAARRQRGAVPQRGPSPARAARTGG